MTNYRQTRLLSCLLLGVKVLIIASNDLLWKQKNYSLLFYKGRSNVLSNG